MPLREDDIDEPDQDKRLVLLAEQQAERSAAQLAIISTFMAIEANLERHWPPFAELVADRRYWDELSKIMAVRLLLSKRGSVALEREGQDRLVLSDAAFLALPQADMLALVAFAEGLLAPGETQRKN